jgi:hypothetical protein
VNVQQKLKDNLPEFDFGVLRHGYMPYMRDYGVIVQFGVAGREGSGKYECLFTHCVFASTETRVRDDVWLSSWDDNLIDYEAWEAAGHPDGYVWGASWSLAYPGLTLVDGSVLAADWSARVKAPMHEVTIETDAYLLRLVFHDVRFRKLGSETSPVDQVLVPMVQLGRA